MSIPLISLTPQPQPRVWLTCMSGDQSEENPVEMVEPLLPYLDGIIWVYNDVSPEAPGPRYLETVKGAGRVIHRSWPAGRHWHSMNETLFTGLMDEGDYVLWVDPLERPMAPFVSRIKTEIGPMMAEAEVGVVFYYGKPYLFSYRETLEYRSTPHWSLQGWSGRAIEWSQIEPDEKLVRFNVRPLKRTNPYHWVEHYARYYVAYPAGSNTCALGLEQCGEKDLNVAFARRETRRLEFRREMKRRGYPLTLEGLKDLLGREPDDVIKAYLRGEKVLSDLYHYLRGNAAALKDTHNPSDAIPIP